MSEGENTSGVPEPERSDSGKHGGRRNNNRGRNNDVPFPVVGVDVSKRDGASVPTVEVENGTLKYLKSVNENMRRQGEAEALEKLKSRLRTVFPDNLEKIVRRGGTGTRKPLSQEEVIEHFLKTHSGLEKFALQSRWDRVLGSVKRYFQSGDFTNGLLGIRDEGARKRKTDQVLAFIGMKGVDEWEKEGNPGSVVQNQSDLPLVDSPEGNVSSQEDVSDVAQDADQTGDQKLVQMEQRAPNEDGVVDGVGLVEEPKPEIVFDEDESNSVVAPDQVGAVVEGSKPKIVFDKDASHGEVVNDQKVVDNIDPQESMLVERIQSVKSFDELLTILSDPKFPGIQRSKQFYSGDDLKKVIAIARETGATNYATSSYGFRDTVERLLKAEREGAVVSPNEDGVVEGADLVEEPKIEDIEGNAKVKKESVTLEGEFSRISVEEARQEMEKAGKVYADLRGREDKMRNRLPKFLLSLVGKGEKTDATKQERIWRGTVSEYQQLRLEEIKQTAKSEKWSSDRLKKEMAELVRETDIRVRLAAISHYDNAKWGESGETWKTRLLGRSKKFAEGYRAFCKEHKVAAFALRGGLLLGSGALGGAALALPMGVLMRVLGSYGAARALKEFFDRRANEKLVVEAEQSEALKSVEKMVVTPENLAKFQEQLRKTDVVEQFEGFRKGAKRRASMALFMGGGLFLGGMVLSHFTHAAQDVVEAKSAVKVGDVVNNANHDAGNHIATVEPASPTVPATPEIPVGAPSAAETVVSGVTESAIHHASLEAAPLVVRAGSSIEGTIIEHLTGTGMSKEEAVKVAHRMALAYAREHHIPFKELGIVQPNTKLSITPNLNNVKTPFQISGDIAFGPKVSETPVLELQSLPKSNVVSLDDHRVKVTPPVMENVSKPVIGTVSDKLLEGRIPSNAGEILKASQEMLAPISADFQHQLGTLNMPNVESAARADISNLFTQERDVKQMSGEVFKLLFPGQQLIRTETALSLLRHGTFHEDAMVRMSQISSALRQLCGYKGSVANWLFRQNETLGEWLNRISEAIMKSPEYQSHISSTLKKAA